MCTIASFFQLVVTCYVHNYNNEPPVIVHILRIEIVYQRYIHNTLFFYFLTERIIKGDVKLNCQIFHIEIFSKYSTYLLIFNIKTQTYSRLLSTSLDKLKI
jgi:hypothetical protein